MKEMPPRRRDEFSDWHDLMPANCPDCGCEYYYAKDDHEIIWEPGTAWSEHCTHPDCHCHTAALEGKRRS